MNRVAVAQKLVKLAKELAAGRMADGRANFDLPPDLAKGFLRQSRLIDDFAKLFGTKIMKGSILVDWNLTDGEEIEVSVSVRSFFVTVSVPGDAYEMAQKLGLEKSKPVWMKDYLPSTAGSFSIKIDPKFVSRESREVIEGRIWTERFGWKGSLSSWEKQFDGYLGQL
jgi:hypothetical protein